MFFFGPFYRWLVEQLDGRINHFPLIRLSLYSLDHAILLFIGWFVAWSIFIVRRKKHGKPIYWRWEMYLHGFVFYMLLLFQLTVFRNENPFEMMTIHLRSLSDIQWIPFVDSVKLFFNGSIFAAYYNVLGNVVWFFPLGLFCGMLYGIERGNKAALWIGLITSTVIEGSQFIFMTGVSHIDDVLCNVLGSVIGFWCYKQYQQWKRRKYEQRNHR